MKRRIINIALCLFMLMTAVVTAACGEDDLSDVGEEQVESAMTLTLWGIKGPGTTDEAIAMVEEAMSSITEAQFNTAIRLMLFTEAEYDKALEAKMDEIQAKLDAEEAEEEARKQAEKEAKKNNETLAEEETSEGETTVAADETVLNEYGLVEVRYPDVEDTQLDIFLMTDLAMFKKYQEKEVLTAVDEQLASSAKLLKAYIHPLFLEAGKQNGSTYAILNNQKVGEYKYMLLNKSLMDKYYYDADDITSFNDAGDFIRTVIKNENIKAFAGDISPVNINYFTPDGSRSIVGSMLAPGQGGGTNGVPRTLLASRLFTEYLKLVKEIEEANSIGSETINPGDKFAVGIINGEPADVAAFEEEYYINVLQTPQGTNENVYNGMFAVSTYSKNIERSMEIITYLNTRSDLRNLFGYGIRGVHYDLDKDGVVMKLSNDYNMKLEYTGNSFIAYPPEGSYPEIWEDAKLHNLDLVKTAWFGFYYDEAVIDPAARKGVKAFSDAFYKELENKTREELNTWLTEKWDDADVDAAIQSLVATEPAGDSSYESLAALYNDWFSAAYPAT